jgi:hypothetical protein
MAEFRLPHRSPDQPILDAISSDLDVLEGEERIVAREVLKEALLSEGRETVGELLDDLEAASREERRERVERARSRAGLPSLSSIEFDEAQRQRDAAAPPLRGADGGALQICHEPSCRAFPVDRVGAHAPHPARKWWCDQHRHLAADGDMEPWRSSLRWTPGPRGVIDVEEDAQEAARWEAELERRRQRREANEAERRAEAEVLAEYERAAEEQRRRETPAGLP